MKKKHGWSILFCAECHEPVTPGQAVHMWGSILCDSCMQDDYIHQGGKNETSQANS